MKKVGLIGIVGMAVIIVVAIFSAGQMGKTSPAFARGKVMLSDELKDKAGGIETLFIIITDNNQPMPPFGALRKSLSEPLEGELYEFALTYDRVQRMRPELPWPKDFKIKARLDKDGVAGPDQPGDLVGEISSVNQGAEDLRLVIDKLVE